MTIVPSQSVHVSAPGRVCLFGEHQDYLHLPVVACAISLRLSIKGERKEYPAVSVHLPDIGAEESFSVEEPLAYTNDRDYLRSALNVVRRHGFTFHTGIEATVRGDIPINAGTSSSSALVLAWIALLACLSDQGETPGPDALARMAHEAEVVEFGEPGGMMDHVSCARGGITAIDFVPGLRVEPLQARLGTFVLGDSREAKDTTEILSRVKDQVVAIADRLHGQSSSFSLETVAESDLVHLAADLLPAQHRLLQGTLRNRDLTRAARAALKEDPVDHRRVGELLTAHHQVLRDILRISTPKIDRMLAAATEAGAYGGKINGSGGGGCMFAYAPEHPERVAEAVEAAGGRAYLVSSDGGVRVDAREESVTHG
jgi:galactokinase